MCSSRAFLNGRTFVYKKITLFSTNTNLPLECIHQELSLECSHVQVLFNNYCHCSLLTSVQFAPGSERVDPVVDLSLSHSTKTTIFVCLYFVQIFFFINTVQLGTSSFIPFFSHNCCIQTEYENKVQLTIWFILLLLGSHDYSSLVIGSEAQTGIAHVHKLYFLCILFGRNAFLRTLCVSLYIFTVDQSLLVNNEPMNAFMTCASDCICF